MVELVDKVRAFEKFQTEILPALQKDMDAGLSAEDIYRKYESFLAARAVTIAMTEVDTGKALSAIKEALDRSKGKATEKVDVTHKYDKLKDEELDALLTSRLKEANSEDKKVQ
jgi:hypothetical protein